MLLLGRYDGHDAVLDLPSAHWFRNLSQAYPRAKFILTVLEPDAWYDRMRDHVLARLASHGGLLPRRITLLFETVFGSANVDDRALWIDAFRRHTADVLATLPPDRLLVMDILKSGDGWVALCAFLHRDKGPCAAPAARPFPSDAFAVARNATIDARFAPLAVGATSRFGYVCLLAHPAAPAQRGYFASFLVAAESIRRTNSTQDIVALVFGNMSVAQQQVLANEVIKTVRIGTVGPALPPSTYIPATMGGNRKESIFAIYRAKINLLRLVEYEAVLFFDSDLVLRHNCDHLFEVHAGAALVAQHGQYSALNAGFMLLRPSLQAFVDIDDVVGTRAFDSVHGWLSYGPIPNWRNPHSNNNTIAMATPVPWTRFFGAHVEQGLLYYYYFLLRPDANATLLSARDPAFADLFWHFIGNVKPFDAQWRGVPLERVPEVHRAATAAWRGLLRRVEARVGPLL